VDRLFGEWGVPKASPAGRQELARSVEARRRAEENPDCGAIFHVRRSRKSGIFDHGTAATFESYEYRIARPNH
jgi:hypothetical protein